MGGLINRKRVDELFDNTDVGALVQSLPIEKRPAFTAAFKAAVAHMKASQADYGKAFEINRAMLENVWRFGDEALQLKADGHLSDGKPAKNGTFVTWADLGVSHQDGGRAIRVSERFTLDALRAWHDEQWDDATYKLPKLSALTETAHVSHRKRSRPQSITRPRMTACRTSGLGGCG